MAIRIDHPFFGSRLALAIGFTCLWFSILCVRLWYLQCAQGEYFRDLSENNRTRTVRTLAPRGSVYDRDNRVLVKNRPAFEVSLMQEDIQNLDSTLAEIAEITGRDINLLRKQLASFRKRRHFEPQVVIPDATFDEISRLRVNGYRLPGVIIGVSPTRLYPYNSLAAQLFGYAREITKTQLENPEFIDAGYRQGDIVGQTGIERALETSLQGRPGFVQVEVDAMGNRKSELGIVDSTPGLDVYLSVDLDLQQVAERELAGKRGAVVALDPNTGEVLALASSPSFDANVFSGEMLATEWQLLTTDKERPLRNRAIGEVYPAGSTFKLVLSVAALAEKKITPSTVLNCSGAYTFGGRPYRCHKRSGHGSVDLKHALAVSCNAYFYQVGQMLGVDTIHKYATLLGLGTITGIDIPGETEGLIPSEEWKKRKLGERWYPGETISVSIGQGYVAITPLQMAVLASTIANGGKVFQPRLVRRIVNPASGAVEEFAPKMERELSVPPNVWAQVRDIAAGVVNSKFGTGTKAALPGIVVAGKTGTAQVMALGKEGSPDDHAWFVSFAPADHPLIASAVLVENGGHGGSAAAPITHDLYETFFRKRGMLHAVTAQEEKPAAQSGSEDEQTEGNDLPSEELPDEEEAAPMENPLPGASAYLTADTSQAGQG